MFKKINFIITLFILATFLAIPSNTQAAACDFPISGNTTISTSCSIPAGSVMGVDDSGNDETSVINTAVLDLDVSADITINSTSSGTTTLAVGSLTITTGGSIIIGTSNARIKINQPIYFSDADGDGWGTDFNYSIATAPGKRRRSLMKSISLADCDDADAGTAGGTSNTYYQDLDGDNYGNSSVSQSACSQPSGYVVNNTDCYDADPGTTNAELAYPGSSTCSGSNRGDGSFDYNCSSTQTKCGTINDRTCQQSGSFSQARCIGAAGDKHCGTTTLTYYHHTQAIDCGVTGCICLQTAAKKTNCTYDLTRCWFNTSGSYCDTVSSSAQTCQ